MLKYANFTKYTDFENLDTFFQAKKKTTQASCHHIQAKSSFS